MEKDVQVSRKNAILCVILCVIFTALTTYQCCFYFLFENYRRDLADATEDFLSQLAAKDVEIAALEDEIRAHTSQIDELTARLCDLTGSPDGTAEDALRLLLRRALREGVDGMHATTEAAIDAEVDTYMAAHADGYLAVCERLLFIDYLYQRNYYEEGPTTDELKDAITRGYIAAAGDLFAGYYTPEEYEAFLDKLRARVSGVGLATAYLADSNELLVLHPHSAGPARAAGIRKFDRIVAVDGKPFSSEEEASAAVAGEVGTSVTLTVARGGERFDLTLTRASVTADSVIADRFEENGKKIGYIRILSFSTATAEQFASAYEELADKGIEALVLDVRDNGGGQLNTLIDLLNYILPKDTPLLSYSFRNDTLAREDVYAKDDGKEIDLPISVLINRNTASAGELLASVLRASGRATLVGERSFGKGSMQSGYLFRDGAYLSVSVATLSPIGLPTHHGAGLVPDILCAVGEGYEKASIYVLPFDEDHPLQAALSLAAGSDA